MGICDRCNCMKNEEGLSSEKENEIITNNKANNTRDFFNKIIEMNNRKKTQVPNSSDYEILTYQFYVKGQKDGTAVKTQLLYNFKIGQNVLEAIVGKYKNLQEEKIELDFIEKNGQKFKKNTTQPLEMVLLPEEEEEAEQNNKRGKICFTKNNNNEFKATNIVFYNTEEQKQNGYPDQENNNQRYGTIEKDDFNTVFRDKLNRINEIDKEIFSSIVKQVSAGNVDFSYLTSEQTSQLSTIPMVRIGLDYVQKGLPSINNKNNLKNAYDDFLSESYPINDIVIAGMLEVSGDNRQVLIEWLAEKIIKEENWLSGLIFKSSMIDDETKDDIGKAISDILQKQGNNNNIDDNINIINTDSKKIFQRKSIFQPNIVKNYNIPVAKPVNDREQQPNPQQSDQINQDDNDQIIFPIKGDNLNIPPVNQPVNVPGQQQNIQQGDQINQGDNIGNQPQLKKRLTKNDLNDLNKLAIGRDNIVKYMELVLRFQEQKKEPNNPEQQEQQADIKKAIEKIDIQKAINTIYEDKLVFLSNRNQDHINSLISFLQGTTIADEYIEKVLNCEAIKNTTAINQFKILSALIEGLRKKNGNEKLTEEQISAILKHVVTMKTLKPFIKEMEKNEEDLFLSIKTIQQEFPGEMTNIFEYITEEKKSNNITDDEEYEKIAKRFSKLLNVLHKIDKDNNNNNRQNSLVKQAIQSLKKIEQDKKKEKIINKIIETLTTQLIAPNENQEENQNSNNQNQNVVYELEEVVEGQNKGMIAQVGNNEEQKTAYVNYMVLLLTEELKGYKGTQQQQEDTQKINILLKIIQEAYKVKRARSILEEVFSNIGVDLSVKLTKKLMEKLGKDSQPRLLESLLIVKLEEENEKGQNYSISDIIKNIIVQFPAKTFHDGVSIASFINRSLRKKVITNTGAAFEILNKLEEALKEYVTSNQNVQDIDLLNDIVENVKKNFTRKDPVTNTEKALKQACEEELKKKGRDINKLTEEINKLEGVENQQNKEKLEKNKKELENAKEELKNKMQVGSKEELNDVLKTFKQINDADVIYDVLMAAKQGSELVGFYDYVLGLIRGSSSTSYKVSLAKCIIKSIYFNSNPKPGLDTLLNNIYRQIINKDVNTFELTFIKAFLSDVFKKNTGQDLIIKSLILRCKDNERDRKRVIKNILLTTKKKQNSDSQDISVINDDIIAIMLDKVDEIFPDNAPVQNENNNQIQSNNDNSEQVKKNREDLIKAIIDTTIELSEEEKSNEIFAKNIGNLCSAIKKSKIKNNPVLYKTVMKRIIKDTAKNKANLDKEEEVKLLDEVVLREIIDATRNNNNNGINEDVMDIIFSEDNRYINEYSNIPVIIKATTKDEKVNEEIINKILNIALNIVTFKELAKIIINTYGELSGEEGKKEAIKVILNYINDYIKADINDEESFDSEIQETDNEKKWSYLKELLSDNIFGNLKAEAIEMTVNLFKNNEELLGKLKEEFSKKEENKKPLIKKKDIEKEKTKKRKDKAKQERENIEKLILQIHPKNNDDVYFLKDEREEKYYYISKGVNEIYNGGKSKKDNFNIIEAEINGKTVKFMFASIEKKSLKNSPGIKHQYASFNEIELKNEFQRLKGTGKNFLLNPKAFDEKGKKLIEWPSGTKNKDCEEFTKKLEFNFEEDLEKLAFSIIPKGNEQENDFYLIESNFDKNKQEKYIYTYNVVNPKNRNRKTTISIISNKDLNIENIKNLNIKDLEKEKITNLEHKIDNTRNGFYNNFIEIRFNGKTQKQQKKISTKNTVLDVAQDLIIGKKEEQNIPYKDIETKFIKNKNIEKNNLNHQSEDEIGMDN